MSLKTIQMHSRLSSLRAQFSKSLLMALTIYSAINFILALIKRFGFLFRFTVVFLFL